MLYILTGKIKIKGGEQIINIKGIKYLDLSSGGLVSLPPEI